MLQRRAKRFLFSVLSGELQTVSALFGLCYGQVMFLISPGTFAHKDKYTIRNCSCFAAEGCDQI